MNIHVIHPGRASCHYHGEDDQEDFLIIKGECRLLIEGQERLLKTISIEGNVVYELQYCGGAVRE